MKKSLLALMAFATLLISCNQKETKIESEDDKTFYSVGNVYGKRFKEFNLTEREVNALLQGVKDGMTKDVDQITELAKAQNKDLNEENTMKYAYKFRDIIQTRMEAGSKIEKEKGQAFLEAFVKNEGGQKTASGLAYKIITPGDKNKMPKSTDEVSVHYKGTLINGTEFDSSYKRGNPIQFPLDKVIKGWTEGMQLIGVGGKIKLVIPSELAYKDAGAPPSIPGGATLIFEVELVDVMKK